MAKKRKITRTITVTTITALIFNVEENEVKEYDFTELGEMDNDEALTYLRRNYETEQLKVVRVISTLSEDNQYQMYEEDFVRNATIKG